MRHRRLLMFCLLLAALTAGPAATKAEAPLGAALARALADPQRPQHREDGTLTVWVRFGDRGAPAGGLAAAIDARKQKLPERTLQRRARVRPRGEPLVDASDLPPSAAYVEAVAQTGARVRRESRWLNAVSVDATEAQIAAIRALPFVRGVDLLARFRRSEAVPTAAELAEAARLRDEIAADKSNPWNLDYGLSRAQLEQINVPPVHELGVTGEGVIIGMLDTGYKLTHAALANVEVIAAYDFINNDEIVENQPGDPTSQHNHGTITLSTVAGFKAGELVGPAFGARVILAKTEDVSLEQPIEEDWWVAGLEWVESLGADVVSSSLGYYDWYTFADLDGNTAVTTIAADLAAGRGLVVVTSAGNSRNGFGHIIAPADGDSVIAVGAVNLSGQFANFSSPGPTYDGRIKPDVTALGVSNHVVSLNNDYAYGQASGTSLSCPLISGVAALILSRTPTLTPMQVREALRETADRAHAPDNDYGWGIVDALAAVTYWGATIVHEPLPDTEDTTGPVTITATITNRLPLDPARMHVRWRVGAGVWQQAALVAIGGDQWQTTLPAQPAGTSVSYYLEVVDTADVIARLPVAGSAAPFSYMTGPDLVPPTLAHTPLATQSLLVWPPLVEATASDNLGLDRVELVFAHEGGAPQGPFPLTDLGGGSFALPLPLAAGDVGPGDAVTYTLTAWDLAGQPNGTTSGPHTFMVVDALGDVLVIDDRSPLAGLDEDSRLGAWRHKDPLPPPVFEQRTPVTALTSSADAIVDWLTAAGYAVTTVPSGTVSPGHLAGRDAVVLAAGNNTAPVASADLRDLLRDWVAAGGRLLLEGGELGYEALVSPGYPQFASEVLHAGFWRADNAGALVPAPGEENHPLLQGPHPLPSSFMLTYGGYADQDAVDPVPSARVVLQGAAQPGAAGVLVHDDTPSPEAGQVVYVAFNLGALAPAIARPLVLNALHYLLAEEPAPTAVVSGTVSLYGGGDASGVVVSLPPAASVVTGPDGHFTLSGLYAGPQVLTAARPGWSTVHVPLNLAAGEVLSGLEITLWPVTLVQVLAAPGVAIPDHNAQGVTSSLVVAPTGELNDLSVDIEIRHTWIGDLTVRLTSPAGTTVTLHNRTGGNAHDLIGNWPQTLTVDGPGALADFVGQPIQGTWQLFVSDTAAGDTGTLEMWRLNLLAVLDMATAADEPPRRTLLAGNVPNPFNPQTAVAFDLARPGPVRLELFDARGRLVRRLLAQDLAAGRHQVIWDGRDGDGRAVASGVYLVRLAADGLTQQHKMMLVR